MVFTLYYRLGPSAMSPAANGRLGGTIEKNHSLPGYLSTTEQLFRLQ